MADHHPGAGGEGVSAGSLTVLFEDPFWIGLFELADREGFRVCKVTFGAEPSEPEIMKFVDRKRSSSADLNSGRPRKRKSTGGIDVHLEKCDQK